MEKNANNTKWNWGTGIALALGLFMAAMGGFFVWAVVRNEPVAVDRPYEAGLDYQKQLDAETRAARLSEVAKVSYNGTKNEVALTFSFGLAPHGEIKFLRPSDKKLDQTRDFSGDTRFDVSSFPRGKWNVEISWTEKGQTFFHREALYLQ